MRQFILLISLILSICFQWAIAEDIEIYIGDRSQREGQKPQVLIIFDNSGSMKTTVQTKPDYDPTINYENGAPFDNSLNPDFIYFTRGIGVDSVLPSPDSNDDTKRFKWQINACASATARLNTVGYFTGHVREYKFKGNTGSWIELSNNSGANTTELVDCWEDVLDTNPDNQSATLQDGTVAPDGYPVDAQGSKKNPVYYSDNIDAVNSSFGTGEVVTFYTANYLRWYHATDLETVQKSRLEVAQQTIVELLDSAPALEFGLMVFNLNAFSEYQRDGGRIIAKVGSNNTAIIQTVNNIEAETNTPLCESMYEAYRYFSGDYVVFGKADSDTSWWSGGRRISYKANDPARDSSAEDASGKYISPFADFVDENGVTVKRCANDINVILITDGQPTKDAAANTQIAALNPGGEVVSNSYLPSLAHWMHNNDIYGTEADGEQNANIYTIGFGRDAIDDAGVLLARTAELGGGQYFAAEDAVALQRALQVALGDILKVSSNFTAPAVASNSFDRTRSLDSVYYSMFLPQQGPRWQGNIKKLKMVNNVLTDANGVTAIDSAGNIKDSALSYWTDPQEGADGNDVEQGGVAAMLRKKTNRKLYTDIGTGSPLPTLSKSALSTAVGGDAALATYLGIPSSELSNYIDWSRGFDVDDADGDGSHTDIRSDVFGDPLHSRPLVINYGPKENPDVRIVVGTNTGFIHMFDDNGASVDESWAFMPYSLLPNIVSLKDNFAGSSKVYGIDGVPAVYKLDNDNDGQIEAGDGDKVWMFVGMRRGGSSYFAFDLTTPDAPKLMWQLSPGDTGFEELGQSWSTPEIGFVKGYNTAGGVAKPVLIFGAGYALTKDNVAKVSDTTGRGIFIIDAETKAKVWSLTPAATAGTNTNLPISDSVPSSVTPLDSDYDGFVDRLYFADTGGNVWRVDMPDEDTNNWTGYKLAALGGSGTEDRRFFSEPVVARTWQEHVTIKTIAGNRTVIRKQKPFDAVLIGSGNRAHPTATGVNDQLFMLQDWNIVPLDKADTRPQALTTSSLIDITNNPFNTIDTIEAWEDQEALFSTYTGWRYEMQTGVEKSLSAALVLGGVAYYTSFLPAANVQNNTCILEAGSGSLYAFNLNYGSRVFQTDSVDVGDKVPDTLELFLDEDDKGRSKLLLIGVGAGDSSSGTIAPPEACVGGVACMTVRKKCEEEGNCSASTRPLGLKTSRTYTYTEENSSGN